MKKLSGVLKLLLVLVMLGVLGIVVAYSMGSKKFVYSEGLQVEAVSEDVFAHLSAPALIEQWLEGVEDVYPIDEDGNKIVDSEGNEANVNNLQIGSRARVLVKSDGQEFEMVSTLKDARFRTYLETEIESDALVATIRYKLTDVRNDENPKEPNTKVEQVMEIRYKGMYRLMALFSGSAIQAKLKSDLEALKALAEKGEALAAYEKDLEENPRLPATPDDDSDDSDSDDSDSDDSDSDDSDSDDSDSDDDDTSDDD